MSTGSPAFSSGIQHNMEDDIVCPDRRLSSVINDNLPSEQCNLQVCILRSCPSYLAIRCVWNVPELFSITPSPVLPSVWSEAYLDYWVRECPGSTPLFGGRHGAKPWFGSPTPSCFSNTKFCIGCPLSYGFPMGPVVNLPPLSTPLAVMSLMVACESFHSCFTSAVDALTFRWSESWQGFDPITSSSPWAKRGA